jgi:hypothetical protein
MAKAISIRLSPEFDNLVTRWQLHRGLRYKAQALYELIALGYQTAQHFGEVTTGQPDSLTWSIDEEATNAMFAEYDQADSETHKAWSEQNPDAMPGAFYDTVPDSRFEIWFAKKYGAQRGGSRPGSGRKAK